MSIYVYTLHKARKQHVCSMGDGLIAAGEHYYTAVIGGGGLQSLKFPDHVHIGCKQAHEKRAEVRSGNPDGRLHSTAI